MVDNTNNKHFHGRRRGKWFYVSILSSGMLIGEWGARKIGRIPGSSFLDKCNFLVPSFYCIV